MEIEVQTDIFSDNGAVPINTPDNLLLANSTLETESKSELMQGKIRLNTGSEELVVHMLDGVALRSDKSSESVNISGAGKLSREPRGVDEKIPKFGNADYCFENVKKRKQWLEDKTGIPLTHLGGVPVSTESWKGNVENLVGIAQIPIGVVGPLKIKGKHALGSYYVPFATTEGAIVTAYNLGAQVAYDVGGVNVKAWDNGVHISPVFFVENMDDSNLLQTWIELNFFKIKQEAEKTTRFGTLQTIKYHYFDRRLVTQFIFNTADAQGMNMVNIACEQACKYISECTGYQYFVRSNYSSDKKISSHAILSTIGKSVFAEMVIPKLFLRRLRTTPIDIEKVWRTGYLACTKANMIGINAQAANAIAAIFLACGQDIAELSTSCITHDGCEILGNGDLYFSISISSLSIGTVGGGTRLGTQKECLEMMDCYGQGQVLKLAEIIGACVLCGEISTLASIANNTFVRGHQRLGRPH